MAEITHNIEWTAIQANPQDWIVEAAAMVFYAHPVHPKKGEGTHLVFWNDEDAAVAQPWLRREAQKDRASLQPCKKCGHMIYRKAKHAPYCGPACRKADHA